MNSIASNSQFAIPNLEAMVDTDPGNSTPAGMTTGTALTARAAEIPTDKVTLSLEALNAALLSVTNPMGASTGMTTGTAVTAAAAMAPRTRPH